MSKQILHLHLSGPNRKYYTKVVANVYKSVGSTVHTSISHTSASSRLQEPQFSN